MKLELIKETDLEGKIWYYINKDEHFVSGSLKANLDDALKLYDTIKSGFLNKKEILLSENLIG